MRMWLPVERHDRWDPHRSRYRYTQASHSLMYNRLIRPASVSSGELEADLCALPEMPDETTYVFTLQPGAVYWQVEPTNGRAVSASDLIWNIERQQTAEDTDGLPDPSFFRRAAYARTSTAEAIDGDALQLRTDAPDAAYLASVHASPFAWITSPEAAEQFGDDWRDDPSDILRNSGTGPYTPLRYDGYELTLTRSDNWWRSDSAHADGITFASGDADVIASMYEARAVDRADFPLTNEVVDELRERHPEHGTYELPLDAAVELLIPSAMDTESPLSDPRVRRALSLSVDRRTLLQRLYGRWGRLSGPLPWYLDGWALSEEALARYPGYREDRSADLAEVAGLIEAAGGAESIGAVPLVVADLFEGFFVGAGEAVARMLRDASGLEVEREDRPFAEAVDALREGGDFCLLGWGARPAQADPTDEWGESLHSTGAWQRGGGSAELDGLIDQMRLTFDRTARQGIARQVQEILLSGQALSWRSPLVGGIQLGLHQPWLHPDPRLFEFAWTTHRLATSWLDTQSEDYPVGRELPEVEPQPE